MTFVVIHKDLMGHDKAMKQRRHERKAHDAVLCTMAKKGDRRAQDEMIKRYGRLAVGVAKHYSGSGEPIEDLTVEAMRGVRNAVVTFDPSLGFDFGTHALHWARAYVSRYVINSGTIRYPAHKRASAMRAKKSGKINANSEEFDSLRCLSFDAPVGGEKGETLLKDLIESPGSTEDDTVSGELRQQLAQAIKRLRPYEREVIALRFGLNSGPVQGLKEIGERFGISKERVRQIQAQALGKLRFYAAHLA